MEDSPGLRFKRRLPLRADAESVVQDRICSDNGNSDVLHDEIAPWGMRWRGPGP